MARMLVIGAAVVLGAVAAATTAAAATASPWSMCRIKPALAASKLQIPTIRDDIKDLTDFASAEFFQRDNQIFFTIEGDKARSELRFFNQWRVTNATEQKMLGLLELGPAAPGVLRYTWMQIHGGRLAGEPLLRLAWMHKKSIGGVTYRDALFAVVRLNTGHDGGNVRNVYLGQRPDGPFQAEVTVKNSIMTVKINCQTLMNDDVSYWSPYDNYFKAGVYIQASEKPVTVTYHDLRVYP
ncbi:hypothetical protein BU14_1709s0001 [Porphyra umbilicalis]|uniref:Alginate lyase 2 domain-containing protein n=1 Tax=Porphyra umbilicalis TaxID=2786 RepID=A0A1X6NKW6_PORUM|nr:hypothetical protein BU14_1709s0001 [Porphyra umbilicalis]|eukprot:OSX69237.1 hypothetical protein BU14_1709s0001 [Porphyra umbilicalis]